MDPAARREGAARSSGEAEAKALQVLQRLHAEPGRSISHGIGMIPISSYINFDVFCSQKSIIMKLLE